MSYSDLVPLAARYDRQMAGLERPVIQRIDSGIDRAYRELSAEIGEKWTDIAANKSLIPQQQKLLLANQLGDLLYVVRPGQRQEYEALMSQALGRASDLGDEFYGDAITAMVPGADVRDMLLATTGVPIEAVVNQAREGVRRLYRHGDAKASELSAIVEQGLIQNWGPKKVAAAIESTAGVIKSQAKTIALTELNSAFNQPAIARARDAGAWVQWLATGDERMCPICGSRNMKAYNADKIQMPPHPRCRCVAVPMKPEWLADEDLISEQDLAFMAKYHQDGLDALRAQGKTPRNNAPFDVGGPPRAAWTPKLTRPQPLPPKRVSVPPAPPGPATVTSLPKNHAVTLNPRINSQTIDKALDSIGTPGASDRVAQLRQFIDKYEIQAVFPDGSKKPAAELRNAQNKLKWQPYSLANVVNIHEGVNGYTTPVFRHITVATNSRGRRDALAINPGHLNGLIEGIASNRASVNSMAWTITSEIPPGNADTRVLTTYLHEMGHQVHYKAGHFSHRVNGEWVSPVFRPTKAKDLTIYATSNDMEWFAESFSAWMIDAEAYWDFDPVGAQFVEDTIKAVLANPFT